MIKSKPESHLAYASKHSKDRIPCKNTAEDEWVDMCYHSSTLAAASTLSFRYVCLAVHQQDWIPEPQTAVAVTAWPAAQNSDDITCCQTFADVLSTRLARTSYETNLLTEAVRPVSMTRFANCTGTTYSMTAC